VTVYTSGYSVLMMSVCLGSICLCICVYIYIYIHTHTHTHTAT